MTGSSQHIADVEGYRQALSERDSIITRLGQANAVLLGEKEALEAALANAMNEIDLLRRRLYGSKSERGGTSELQLLLGPAQVEHDEILRCIDEAAGAAGAPAPVSTGGPAPVSTGVLEEPAAPPPAPAAPEPAHPSRDGGESVDSGEGKADESGAAAAPDTTAPPQRPRPSPKGRRDLSASKLARVVVELRDARMERVGKFIRWEDSFRLLRQRAELKVLVRRRAVYEGKRCVDPIWRAPPYRARNACMTTRRTRSERAEIVRAYRASKQTAYRFSQDHGVSASSLARWIAEVKEQVDDRVGVDFVRLEVAPAEARGHLFVEVGGARVQVERGFDGKLLRAVVDALGSEP